jgi:hypothetical protein
MDIERELGIGPTSDKREIRRAYARRLKETHPEDDPEGFQRLREAYEIALQQSGWIAEDEAEEDAHADESEQAVEPKPRPARQDSGSAGDHPGEAEHKDDPADDEPDDRDRRAVTDMVAGLGRLLDKGDDRGAAEALEIAVADPVLLNLNNRRLFEFLLLQEVGERDPMPPATARAAAKAFRWDEHWTDLPYDYQYLADQVLAVQLSEERLAELHRAAKKRIGGGFEARAANLLLGPYSPVRFTLAGGADLLTAMERLLAELRAQYPEILEREVDPRVLAWWTEATDDPASRINRRSRMVTWTIIGLSFALGVARAVLRDF